MINRIDVHRIDCPSFLKVLGLSPGVIIIIAGLFVADSVSAQQLPADCGTLANAFGPFDYTDPTNLTPQGSESVSKLRIVEMAHFSADVENLIRGDSGVGPLPDLDYTLRVFPNHHRALNSTANYHIKNHLQKIGLYSIDCWFSRAIEFRSDDAVVRLIYAIFLAKTGKNELALVQYQTALKLQPNSAEAHYNIGLLYSDMRNYDLAFTHAKRAYELRYPLPGLRNRLKAAGVWNANSEN